MHTFVNGANSYQLIATSQVCALRLELRIFSARAHNVLECARQHSSLATDACFAPIRRGMKR